MWHTSYGSATPTFHKYIEAMICCLFGPIAAQQSVFIVHFCNTIAVVHLLNTISKSSVCNIVKSALFVIGSELLQHYCTIIGCVMRTCAPQLLLWQLVLMEFTSGGGAVIGYSLVLLLFRLGLDDRLTHCRLLGENADKLCFLHDNLKLLIWNY